MTKLKSIAQITNSINLVWIAIVLVIGFLSLWLVLKNVTKWSNAGSQQNFSSIEILINQVATLPWDKPPLVKSNLSKLAQIKNIHGLELYDENQQLIESVYVGQNLPKEGIRNLDLILPIGDSKKPLNLKIMITPPQVVPKMGLMGVMTVMIFSWIFSSFVAMSLVHQISKNLRAVEKEGEQLLFETQLNEKAKSILESNKLGEIILATFQRFLQSEQEKLKQNHVIREHSFVDVESGLGNRYYFDAQFAVMTIDQEEANCGALYLVHFNGLQLKQHLKDVKDIALSLNHFLDTNYQGILARRTDTDFALVILNITPQQIATIAEKLSRYLEQVPLTTLSPHERFNIGCAYFQPGSESYEVLAEADMALRTAQLQGQNSWYAHEAHILNKDEILGSVKWRSLLEMAIDNHRYLLVEEFPCIDLVEGGTLFTEVLARICMPENNKVITAARFLPMAHNFGLVPKLERSIIDYLFKRYFYLKEDSFNLAVNLYSDSLLDQVFFEWLMIRLAENIRLAHKLCFEIPESAFAKDNNQLIARCAALIQLGCGVAIEKIGQPIASSDYLHRIPVRYLKLHISVVRKLQVSAEKQLFVKSMVELANQMKIPLIAEGIENVKEYEKLRELGVFGGQGQWIKSTATQNNTELSGISSPSENYPLPSEKE
ncbi:MAG: EAL domain-containing protein [Pseudomonadota bacterium]